MNNEQQELSLEEPVIGFNTFCLATMDLKCDSCQHQKNWNTLNTLSDLVRLPLQKKMTRINSYRCSDNDNVWYTVIVTPPPL